MLHPLKNTVVALVATADRTNLLEQRALPSIRCQLRKPDRVIIVDDSCDDESADRTRHVVRLWQQTVENVSYLRNRRTKGASGAWNTGLDHLLRTCEDPKHVYVAILDDDDMWDTDHLLGCLETAESNNSDMVAAPFWRIDEHFRRNLTTPPRCLEIASFLVGNPGIQGSNLFCRLSVFLEAGLFDESLPSCTDRDLCIRIAELPDVRYRTTYDPTVCHFANGSLERLSTPGSAAKINGLNRFYRKYGSRMSNGQYEAFRSRAERLFNWKEPPFESVYDGGELVVPPRSISQTYAPQQAPPHLIVGLIADTTRLGEVGGLLTDLRDLAGDPDLSGLDVLILENSSSRLSKKELRTLVENEREAGIRIHLVDRARHVEDASRGLVLDGGASRSRKLAIAPARTVLQTYLYTFAKERPGSVVWIVDDDMRLDSLLIEKDGRLRRRSRQFAPFLRELRRLRAGGAVDIAIGLYSGSPPLPFAATVRVQLVDLIASLTWLASLEPTETLPDRSRENAALMSGRRDYYYDLSQFETDRLETPFWLTPASQGERVNESFERMAENIERILTGEQFFRPLAIDAHIDPFDSISDGLQRGGNTFVLDCEALRLAPNPSPIVNGRPSRRSDMLWAFLQKRFFSRQVISLPIALYHDRSRATAYDEISVEQIIDDIRGYAIFSALEDMPGVFRPTTDERSIRLVEGLVGSFTKRAFSHIEERLAAFRLSFYRIRGLSRILSQLISGDTTWWREERYQSARAQLQAFVNMLDNAYKPAVLERIEQETRILDTRRIRAFLEQLPNEIREHRGRLSKYPELVRSLENERVENAKSTVEQIANHKGILSFLGCGKEGVALTDGTHVYKVFDYWWKSSSDLDAPAILRGITGTWKDTRHLYPILDFHESGYRAVLVYPFEDSEPYSGGHGASIVAMLRECKSKDVVCRNIDPANLRVVDGRVRLIDYGSDIHPYSELEFKTMCQRAWLSFRWAHLPNLKQIMREALTNENIPELDGFCRFFEAVNKTTAQWEESEGVVFDMIGNATHVLDYGCGKGKISGRLANRGLQVLGYDPDRSVRPRWETLAKENGSLRFTHDRNDALSRGPFDLVICRRVICTIEDESELRLILKDLRKLAGDSGRIIVTLCDPHFTFGGSTPLEDRRLPPDARYESTFVWQKSIRDTGRARFDVHRPERILRRIFACANLAVVRRVEVPTVDVQRFEPASDQLIFELEPLETLPGEVSLMIKACAMEADTLEVQVPHLVTQLEDLRAFKERLLVIDTRLAGFLRQHSQGSLTKLKSVADHLVNTGWIDRIIIGPDDGQETGDLHQRWFGIPCSRAHSDKGAQIASTLAGFEACATRYVLQVDADIMVGRLDRRHDYLKEMLAVMTKNPETITVAFNIAMQCDRPYTDLGNSGPWRTEVRAGLIDLDRLRKVRPLPNRLSGDRLALFWHRSLDHAIKKGAGRSYRGGDRRTFYVHPPNDRKRDVWEWFAVLDRIERGVIPQIQQGSVDWVGTASDWVGPPRTEEFVFVVSGRNVPAGRFRRCIESMVRQTGPQWGAVVIDDASEPIFADHFEVACSSLGDLCTIIRNRRRRGLLANMVKAIRSICANPESVIVTLDADDALIGDGVLERLAAEYAQGADVSVGSMLRTDKTADYPVCFDNPRKHRGGNVWQHLRSFKKRLYDAIPDEALRLDGEYIDLANDWAYMLPIIELAEKPVHIAEPLYLYEPSGVGRGADRASREEIIARIVAKGDIRKG